MSGKKGENYEKLDKIFKTHLCRKLTIKEAKQNILDFLVPYEYNDEDLELPYESEIPDFGLDEEMTESEARYRGYNLRGE